MVESDTICMVKILLGYDLVVVRIEANSEPEWPKDLYSPGTSQGIIRVALDLSSTQRSSSFSGDIIATIVDGEWSQ